MMHKRLVNQQGGMVSIIVTMIMMIVISLIVIGFSQISRRDQKDTLDRQLSTQAYYAAESGVNDAIYAVNNNLAFAATLPKTNCSTSLPAPLTSAVGTDSSYSCILIDNTPLTFEYSDISVSAPTVVRFSGVKKDDISVNVPIKSIRVSWNAVDGTNSKFDVSSTKYPKFTKTSGWNDGGTPASPLTPVLRTTVTNLASFQRDDLNKETYTAFLYPTDAASSTATLASPFVGSSGEILQGGCDTAIVPDTHPKFCSVIINTSAGMSEVLLQLKSIYGPSTVTIQAYDTIGAGGAQLKLKGGQLEIDSTGKSKDVVRRIRVRVPNNQKPVWPDAAVHSVNGICKLLDVIPGNGNTYIDGSAGAAGCPTAL